MRLILFLVTWMIFANAEITKNDINGIWEIPEEIDGYYSIGEIFTQNEKAYAYAFAYFKKVDNKLISREMQDENKNAKELRGKIFLSNLEFDGEKWINGKIYNPNNGKIYYVKATLSDDKNTLFIKVSIDRFGIIGITLQWNRITDTLYTPLKNNEITMIEELKDKDE